MITTLPLTQARDHFPELVEMAALRYARITITKNGRPAALLMSQEEYESLMETLEILADKKLLKDLGKAQKEVRQGKIIPLEKALKKWNVKV